MNKSQEYSTITGFGLIGSGVLISFFYDFLVGQFPLYIGLIFLLGTLISFGKVECPYCGDEFPNKNATHVHIKEEHPEASKIDKKALANNWNIVEKNSKYNNGDIMTAKVGKEGKLYTILTLVPKGTSTKKKKWNYESKEKRNKKLIEIFKEY